MCKSAVWAGLEAKALSVLARRLALAQSRPANFVLIRQSSASPNPANVELSAARRLPVGASASASCVFFGSCQVAFVRTPANMAAANKQGKMVSSSASRAELVDQHS